MSGEVSVYTSRSVFRYFTPLGPRNFCAPPPPYLFVFSYVQLSFQVQLISLTIPAVPLGTNIIFSIISLKFLSRGQLFFSAYHTSISIFFNMPPLKICRPGPGPRGPVRKYGPVYILHASHPEGFNVFRDFTLSDMTLQPNRTLRGTDIVDELCIC